MKTKNKILFTLQVDCCNVRSDRHEIYLLLRVSLVGEGKWSELFGCFIAVSSEIGKKIKYFQAKQM